MLPNHAPLVVAERFKMLEALFPGRIDLGLGRAPGTDGATAHALRSRLDRREGDDFLERLHELILWETRDFPPGHPYNNVVAMPDDTPLPPIWLLGSSDYSSELAAQVGMGFAFAHHFASYDAIEAMTNYKAHFKPSGWRATPHGILAVAVVAAETDAEAERLASSMDLNRLRRDRGQYLPLPSVEEALAYPYTDSERASIARNRSRLFVGSPATVMAKAAADDHGEQGRRIDDHHRGVRPRRAQEVLYAAGGCVRVGQEGGGVIATVIPGRRPQSVEPGICAIPRSGPSDHPGMTMPVHLLRLLAERRAERMAGIDADDAEFAREEFQFLQREGETRSSGWPSTSA